MGRRGRVEISTSGRSIGQWWTQEAESHLTRLYGKINSLIFRANTVGDVIGPTVQPAAKELEGKPLAVQIVKVYRMMSGEIKCRKSDKWTGRCK
jgi:hypothetical protein